MRVQVESVRLLALSVAMACVQQRDTRTKTEAPIESAFFFIYFLLVSDEFVPQSGPGAESPSDHGKW